MAFKGIQVVINGIDRLSPALESPMRKLDKMGRSFSRVGKMATLGITLPILAAGGAVLKYSIDMNKGMANVATLIPGNVERVKELKTEVQNLGIDTGKATADMTGGLYQVISVFGDSADTAKILGINAKAAAAGLSTTTDAIRLTSAVTKAYGDTSGEAVSRVADLGFQTVKLGATTFSELASSIGKVTPLASTLGVKMEEMFGVFATATGVTGDTANVSTQLAASLTQMIKPTVGLSSMFEALGYSSGEAMIKELGLVGSLQKIVKVAKDSNVPLGQVLGSQRAIVLAMALAGAQGEEFTKKYALMQKEVSKGAMEEAFREQTQGVNELGFTWDQLKVRAEVLGQRLGDKLAPHLNKLLKGLTPIVNTLTDLNPNAWKTIIVLAGLVAVVGPLIFLAGTLATSIFSIYTAITHIPFALNIATKGVALFGTVLKGLFLNPVGLAILSIALLVYNIYLLRKNWGAITDAFSSKFMLFQTLSFFMADLADSISKIVSYIPGLGRLSSFFKDAGKGFRIQAEERVASNLGVSPTLMIDKVISRQRTVPSPVVESVEKAAERPTTKSEVLIRLANLPKGSRVESFGDDDFDLETEYGSMLEGVF